jgi:hypothetical protein
VEKNVKKLNINFDSKNKLLECISKKQTFIFGDLQRTKPKRQFWAQMRRKQTPFKDY